MPVEKTNNPKEKLNNRKDYQTQLDFQIKLSHDVKKSKEFTVMNNEKRKQSEVYNDTEHNIEVEKQVISIIIRVKP